VRPYPGVSAALRELKTAGFLTSSSPTRAASGAATSPKSNTGSAGAATGDIGDGLIDASYFCPDAPGTPSVCRNPNRHGLAAARDFPIDLPRSYFIGDKSADIECGHRAARAPSW